MDEFTVGKYSTLQWTDINLEESNYISNRRDMPKFQFKCRENFSLKLSGKGGVKITRKIAIYNFLEKQNAWCYVTSMESKIKYLTPLDLECEQWFHFNDVLIRIRLEIFFEIYTI